jgi:hypothetical protein
MSGLPIIPVDGPVQHGTIRLRGFGADATEGMHVCLLVDHWDLRQGVVTYVGDEGIEVTLTDCASAPSSPTMPRRARVWPLTG